MIKIIFDANAQELWRKKEAENYTENIRARDEC